MLQLPGKSLLKGSELFGSYEIIDTDGQALLSTDSNDKIKYILYANRNNLNQIEIISNSSDLSITVKKYEKHLDEIVTLINDDFEKEFPTSDKSQHVTNKIFQVLNLHRH